MRALGDAVRPTRADADRLVLEIGGWLDGHPVALRGDDEPLVRRLITAHGLAPTLHREPALADVRAAMPSELAGWLADQDRLNEARIRRLLEELGEVLHALHRAAIETMPLKGAVLATRPGADPYRRPMADLDLLVRDDDRDRARAVLMELGYRRRPDRSRRPTHDTFERPGNERVVSHEEHPDNPRRIELHVEVKRHLWGWVDDDDLTALLWRDATRGEVAGAPATLPTDAALATHLAIHATSDLLMGRGRLLQWLDLAGLVPHVDVAALAAAPHPRLVGPAVLLAARRLPARFRGVDFVPLVFRLPVRLARWAATVPLTTAAGLQSGRITPGAVSTFEARWDRWAPRPWRLAVAYGDLPLPVAVARHAVRLAATAARPRR